MDIGVEIMKKRNKKLTELLEKRRALCDKMTHGVPGCSTDCKLFALRATARACRDSVLEDPARASELRQNIWPSNGRPGITRSSTSSSP